jgi:hypothetical protein
MAGLYAQSRGKMGRIENFEPGGLGELDAGRAGSAID